MEENSNKGLKKVRKDRVSKRESFKISFAQHNALSNTVRSKGQTSFL